MYEKKIKVIPAYDCVKKVLFSVIPRAGGNLKARMNTKFPFSRERQPDNSE
jgi:hypothetical protein